MSQNLSPLFNDEQLDSNGLPLIGGKLYWYLAGTSTSAITFQESTGSTPHTNPIILNSRGEPPAPIWLTSGASYKAILTDSTDNPVRQIDNIPGINDVSAPAITEWVLYSGAASYIDATHFSVVGDLTATFTTNRRVKAAVSGGTVYATINTAVYATGVTTVTVVNDATVLDSGLNTVYYGFLDPTHPSFDSSGINASTKSAFQNQTFTAFTTGGATGAFTLTPVPALTSLVAGQRFRVKFHAAGNGSDTLAVSGLAATALKQYDSAGTKSAPVIALNQLTDVEYDGTNFVILDALTPAYASSATTQTGTSTAAAVTPKGLADTMLGGVGQTWQDLTGASRLNNTTYTNSTGRPIIIRVGTTSAAVESYALTFTLNGVAMPANAAYANSAGYVLIDSLVVPNGATYKAVGTHGISSWWELR